MLYLTVFGNLSHVKRFALRKLQIRALALLGFWKVLREGSLLKKHALYVLLAVSK
jgi:hypothetical protein